MNRRVIVVGTDFSEDAAQAVSYAAQLASAMQAQLRVVHAWNVTGWSPDVLIGGLSFETLIESAREAAQAALRAATEKHASSRLEIVPVFSEGPASRVLPAEASEAGATLLVVGMRGAARLPHVSLGSVSERVVRGAPCPVLVVPSRSEAYALPDRMLVGVDYSNASREAFRAALRLGAAIGSRRRPLLVHAFQDERALWLAGWSEAGLARRNAPDPKALRRWASKEGPSAEGCEFEQVEGAAELSLPTAARLAGCDWIVLGVQGRTALASFLIGSTTNKILSGADRPVLVVPQAAAPEVDFSE